MACAAHPTRPTILLAYPPSTLYDDFEHARSCQSGMFGISLLAILATFLLAPRWDGGQETSPPLGAQFTLATAEAATAPADTTRDWWTTTRDWTATRDWTTTKDSTSKPVLLLAQGGPCRTAGEGELGALIARTSCVASCLSRSCGDGHCELINAKQKCVCTLCV